MLHVLARQMFVIKYNCIEHEVWLSLLTLERRMTNARMAIKDPFDRTPIILLAI